jgi:hypothetical protein
VGLSPTQAKKIEAWLFTKNGEEEMKEKKRESKSKQNEESLNLFVDGIKYLKRHG